jgi:hypothetical protein
MMKNNLQSMPVDVMADSYYKYDVQVYACIFICTQVCIHTYMHMHIHMYIHIYIYMYIYLYICIYQRVLVSTTGGQIMSNRWKTALWEKDSIEPAMLRYICMYTRMYMYVTCIHTYIYMYIYYGRKEKKFIYGYTYLFMNCVYV